MKSKETRAVTYTCRYSSVGLRELCSKSSLLFYSEFPKTVSLCSLLFPKSTEYSHFSQLYCHTFTAFTYPILPAQGIKLLFVHFG